MVSRTVQRTTAVLIALGCALSLARSAPARQDSVGNAWVPALAALGDAVARSDRKPEGQRAVAPILVAVAVSSASNGVAPSAAGDVAAAAVAGARDETERWVPALAFVSGILGQEAEGSVSSDSTIEYDYVARQSGTVISCVQTTPPVGGCQGSAPVTLHVIRSLAEGKDSTFSTAAPPPGIHPLITGFVPDRLVLPVSGGDLFLTPFVGASAELMTPGVQGVPGRPRLFLHADASLAFSFVRNVAKENVPEGAVLPDPMIPAVAEIDIRGVGALTSGEVQTLLLSGGVGTAFTLDAWGRRLRVKPSFEYLREEIEVRGRLVRAFRADTGLSGGVPLNTIPVTFTQPVNAVFLQPIDIEAAKTQGFHGIGPGLEIEMDAARAGPVVLTVFVGGQAYRMLGDLDISVAGSAVVPAQPPYSTTDQPVSARFDFHKHAWSYKGGVGLRFRWLPED